MWILNSFNIIFPIDGEIKKTTLSLWYYVVICYGTCFNYSSFIFIMNEGKYGRILKIESVISKNIMRNLFFFLFIKLP